MTEQQPVTWVKHKYTAPKERGRYKGGTSASSKKSDRKRKKVGGGSGPIEHVKIIRISGFTYPEDAPTGKWLTRPRENARK